MSLNNRLFLLLPAILVVSLAENCFEDDSSNLTPVEFIEGQIGCSKIHLELFEKFASNLKSPTQLELLKTFARKIQRNDRMFHHYVPEISAMMIAGYEDLTTEDELCIFANFLKRSLAVDQDYGDTEELNCVFDIYAYLVTAGYWRAVSKKLHLYGCPTSIVPELQLPSCYHPETCNKENQQYPFCDIWREHEATLRDFEETVYPNDFEVVNKLHNSKNIVDKYLAAIVTTVNVEINWALKSRVNDTSSVVEGTYVMGLLEEALASETTCDCNMLVKDLGGRMNTFVTAVPPVLDDFAEGLSCNADPDSV